MIWMRDHGVDAVFGRSEAHIYLHINGYLG
jgi:hypothetical protein